MSALCILIDGALDCCGVLTAFNADNFNLVVFDPLEFLELDPFLTVLTGRSFTFKMSAMSNFLFLSLLPGTFTSEFIFAVDELVEEELELCASLFTPVFFNCTDYRRKKHVRYSTVQYSTVRYLEWSMIEVCHYITRLSSVKLDYRI